MPSSRSQIVQRALHEAGRDGDDFAMYLAVKAFPDLDLYKRLEDAGVTDLLCAPWMLADVSESDSPEKMLSLRLAEVEKYAEEYVSKMRSGVRPPDPASATPGTAAGGRDRAGDDGHRAGVRVAGPVGGDSSSDRRRCSTATRTRRPWAAIRWSGRPVDLAPDGGVVPRRPVATVVNRARGGQDTRGGSGPHGWRLRRHRHRRGSRRRGGRSTPSPDGGAGE